MMTATTKARYFSSERELRLMFGSWKKYER